MAVNVTTSLTETARPDVWARVKGAWNAFWSPGTPLPPIVQQAQEEGGAPRIRDFTPGQNQGTTPRAEEKNITAFAQLRSLAANYDVAGICIQFLQQELGALDWKIVPVDADDRLAAQRLSGNIKRVTDRLQYPDGELLLDQWTAMLLAEDLEVAAPVIYKHKTRGGKLGPLEIIQGDTIKPVLDIRGRSAAYQQIWHGVPLGLYSPADMMYVPRVRRRGSAYGIAPIERVLVVANTALRRQSFELSYFTDGNIPELMMAAPEGWSPKQIAEFQEWFDGLLVGNDNLRRRLRMVPTDPSKSLQVKSLSESTGPQEWLLKVCCAAFNVKPEEIGFTMHVNRATANAQAESQERMGVQPLAKWIEDIFTRIIQQAMKEPELRFDYDLGGKVDDRFAKAQTDQLNIQSGIYSAAYVRNRDGIDLDPSDPLLQPEEPLEPAPDDAVAETEAEPADDTAGAEQPADAGEEGGNVLTLALNAGELQKEGTGKKGPGSRGGQYWIDAKGKVRYGARPTATKQQTDKAKATADRKAARQKLTAEHKATAAQKKAERQKIAAEKHALMTAKGNARDELKAAHDLSEMSAKGWKTEGADGFGTDKEAANDAARQAGLKDKGSVFAVVKVNGAFYVVSKGVKNLQGERSGNTVSGGSHKTKESDVRSELEGGKGGAGGKAMANAARSAELRKWREKSIGRLRAGRSAMCDFTSPEIDHPTVVAVADGLLKARTAADVKAVFAPLLAGQGDAE